MTEREPGARGAVAEALRTLAERVPPHRLDRIWIFPPRIAGRKESGVIAAGCVGDGERLLLVTLAYRAEETGKGLSFEPTFQEEGEAPEDRLERIMKGVVSRSREPLGVPRAIRTGGDPDAFQRLLEEEAMPLTSRTGPVPPASE